MRRGTYLQNHNFFAIARHLQSNLLPFIFRDRKVQTHIYERQEEKDKKGHNQHQRLTNHTQPATQKKWYILFFNQVRGVRIIVVLGKLKF